MMSSQFIQPGTPVHNNMEEGEDYSGFIMPSPSKNRFGARASINRPTIRSRRPSREKSQRRRRKSRPLTPDIVIERRSHRRRRHHHQQDSSDGHQIIRIPFYDRPTLGLRGPPKRFIEIERIPCRRKRRRCYSPCDTSDFSRIPSIVASPPIIQTPQASNWLENLTVEMLEKLPRRTIHLSPIYLPGSQATTETPLQTVVLPAEIINPIDGSLSVIKMNQITRHDASLSHEQSFNASSGLFKQQLSQLIQQSFEPLTFLNRVMTNTSFPYISQGSFSSPSVH